MEAAVIKASGCLVPQLSRYWLPLNITEEEHLMVSFKKLAIPVVAGILLLGGLAACDREGPMERAGEKVDRSVERAGDRVERATDK